jgi:hypothetical protein
MFRGIQDRIKLYKLDRQEKKLDAEGERVHKEAREKKDQEIFDEWWEGTASRQYRHIEWNRKNVVSGSLIDEADKLHLPRPHPSDDDKWEERPTGTSFGDVLTLEAMTDLRATIRREKRERRETVEWWVKTLGGIIGIITGLVGALIGLVSVWKHR